MTHKNQEIERKFLLCGTQWKKEAKSTRMRQGYLNDDKERTVRVRIVGNKGFLTIKGKNNGAVRTEFEYEIPFQDADRMLDELALKPLIEKTRHVVQHAGHTWEIDEFEGDNLGLIVAEIELTSESEVFDKPDWIGKEVTGDTRYYNSSLVKHPYCRWN